MKKTKKMNHPFNRIFFTALFFLIISSFYSQLSKESQIINNVSKLIDNAKFDEAHKRIDSLIPFLVKSNNIKTLAYAYNVQGTLYKGESKYKEAINCFNKAIAINIKIKDNKRLAGNYMNLASTFSDIGENKSALNYNFKALKLLSDYNDYQELAVLYNNIGNLYKESNQMANSNYYLKKALGAAKVDQDSLTMAMVYHNIGSNMTEMNRNDSSLIYFENSLKYLSNYSEGIGHIFNYKLLGESYIKLNNLKKAENYLLQSLRISKETGISYELESIYKSLSEVYKKMGVFPKAYEYLSLSSHLKDSINRENTRAELMKQEYDNELGNQKKLQEQEQKSRDAINNAKLDGKNKIIYFSYVAIGIFMILIFFVIRSNRQKQKANQIISKQKEIVEQKNEEILSSINYAKRIQQALLAHDDLLNVELQKVNKHFSKRSAPVDPSHFVFYQPKDIVSGDFYWATYVAPKSSLNKNNETKGKFYIAICDSTGHGVPGAFMSLLNIGFLSEAINEKGIEEPNEVFNFVRERLIDNVSKEGQKDGFDGILVCFDLQTSVISYAAANNAPVVVHNNLITELDYDRMPVGMGERKEDFKLYTVNSEPGDTIYLYTDGYADQFGGPKGKKFKYKSLNELLLSVHSLKTEEQKNILRDTFDKWKGDLEQVDDVCIIGIRL